MRLDLSRIGQIAMSVADADRAEAFYENALGLRKLFRFGDLVFFDCAGLAADARQGGGSRPPSRAPRRSISAAPTSRSRSPS